MVVTPSHRARNELGLGPVGHPAGHPVTQRDDQVADRRRSGARHSICRADLTDLGSYVRVSGASTDRGDIAGRRALTVRAGSGPASPCYGHVPAAGGDRDLRAGRRRADSERDGHRDCRC